MFVWRQALRCQGSLSLTVQVCGRRSSLLSSRKVATSFRSIQTEGIISETKHLGPGSECPPLKPGTLRLYSMKLCPFAERTRLVLSVKKISHEIVNVNMKNKPGWYVAMYEAGKVPALQIDDKFVPESVVTSDLLEELYPKPALYPSDPWKKAQDRFMVENFNSCIGTLYQMYRYSDDAEKIEELSGKLRKNIQPFEAELARRGTPFFHGERPGMLDLMIWPWIERMPAFGEVCRSASTLSASDRHLSEWVSRMSDHAYVKPCLISTEEHINYLVTHKTGIVAAQQRNAQKSAVVDEK